MKVITDEKKIDEVLSRGVITSVLPIKEDFKKLLMSGKRIKIYIGFDATADTLHLSHAKNIILLEEFRKLGHEAILLFGDFTARIGDPSDQAGTRKILTAREVLDNVKSWKNQIKNLMDFNNKENPPKVLFNSKWLAKMTMEEVLELASNITVGQMIERDMFQKRMKEGKHIFLHEFLYPLMQGYDSVAMEVDAELCGTDQIFNALMGRTLLRKLKNKEKFVVAVNLMENPKTGELMSKSRGTGVFLNTTATEMFGSIMAQPDENMQQLFIDCTWLELNEINGIMKSHPKEAKIRLAFEITKMYHGEKKAMSAKDNFEQTFSKGGIPRDIKTVKTSKETPLVEIFLEHGLVSSKSEFNRLNKEGAIKEIENGVYRVGKHRFLRIEQI